MPTDIPLSGRLGREAVACDHALVVEAHERDHILDVGLGHDPASAEARPAREHRVVVDSPLLEERAPDLLRKAEMSDVLAVQVADLPPAYLERANSPRLPGAAATPGQEVTSSVIRSLALRAIVMTASSQCA